MAQPSTRNANLVIAGAKGFQRIFGAYQETGSEVPHVIYTGHVSEGLLPALYSGASSFFYLSSYEGFGIPPLEAMACGTPVCVGNKTALPEVVGEAGILVDPFDVDAVVDVIKAVLLGDLSISQYRALGLAQAQKFTWEKVANKTLEVFNQYSEFPKS